MARKAKKSTKTKRQRERRRHVVLRLVGSDLDPDKITRSLGLEPASAQPAASLGREFKRIYNTTDGHWCLDSRLRTSATLQNQLEDIAKQIRPKRRALRAILKNVEADVNIAVEPHDQWATCSYLFSAEVISEFTSLGIDICFSIHDPHNIDKVFA